VLYAWAYLALALLGARWWWPLWRTLRAELRAAAEPMAALTYRRVAPQRAPPPIAEESRVPPQRVLAFRGVARRVAARRRFEGGFGRRGL
jgi:hypothetical protein